MAVNSLQHSFLCNNTMNAAEVKSRLHLRTKNIGGLRVRIGITIF